MTDDKAVKAAANALYKGDITEVMVILAMASAEMATWILKSNESMQELVKDAGRRGSDWPGLGDEMVKVLETTRDVARVAKAWAEGDENYHAAHKATDAKPGVLH